MECAFGENGCTPVQELQKDMAVCKTTLASVGESTQEIKKMITQLGAIAFALMAALQVVLKYLG